MKTLDEACRQPGDDNEVEMEKGTAKNGDMDKLHYSEFASQAGYMVLKMSKARTDPFPTPPPPFQVQS